MKRSEFAIGRVFTTGQGLWRCTDVGTRTVIAIRTDSADVVSILGGREAPSIVAPSWFDGPPYALAGTMLDKCDFPALQQVPEWDMMKWRPEPGRGSTLNRQERRASVGCSICSMALWSSSME
ncbi:hypothetical protein GCM10011504_56480 [Siccirubricoccus deserti]|uniref:Uncharacterized protein n=1 Tax=Siccirubricoccus deserti TaxID=2013562 RepID=A0A9X0R3H0_9PROT|nr:hypothetical protein [Siccirubricoccus deserti]MBC4018965.1 hypothetical protein [Siccirubricoccus deserti]GGC71507.1 hypothetical protein GCM10011504_56480 [Siccirubricoccus deserti]